MARGCWPILCWEPSVAALGRLLHVPPLCTILLLLPLFVSFPPPRLCPEPRSQHRRCLRRCLGHSRMIASQRLSKAVFRVAASFNTANETSIIHPLLRASVTNLYIQGMCAPLTEFNRFTGLFRIDSFDKNTPLVSSKEYAINFTTVEKLKYNCMYTLDR
ncbi:hypothetical protein J6590_032551, partial [Homalodisca vitripennis]